MCLMCFSHRCRVGGGQGHSGDQEAASGGVIPNARALSDDSTAALAVAAGERTDDECAGSSVCGSQHA